MKKIIAGLLALCLIPLGVNAETKTVSTEADLRNALSDTNVTEITLGDDIKTLGKINIERDVTIDGQGKSITYVGEFFATVDGEGSADNTIWSRKSSNGEAGAVYVLQVYKSNVIIKDITLAGGNRGLAVNGGNATLAGTVNFENNGFQDIELSKGKDVANEPSLTFGYLAKVNSDNPYNDNLIVVQAPDKDRTTGEEFETNAKIIINGESKTYKAVSDQENNITLSDTQEALKTVKLTFVAEGESETIEVPFGLTATEEEADELINTVRELLKDDGYTIDGFYADEALTVKYDFTKPIEEDTTVYMKLVELEDATASVPQEVANAKTGDMNLIMVLSLLGLAGAAVAVTGKKIFLSNI